MVTGTTTLPSPVATGEGDAALLARVATGEHAGLAEFYDRYARRVYSLARRICVDEKITEDAVQDTPGLQVPLVLAAAGR